MILGHIVQIRSPQSAETSAESSVEEKGKEHFSQKFAYNQGLWRRRRLRRV